MSVERSLEAWEEMQRHGQDLADRLAQGFNGLIHSPPPFAWPSPAKSPSPADLPIAAAAVLDIGNRLGQAGAELSACLGGVVQQFFRRIPVPFRQDDGGAAEVDVDSRRRGLAIGTLGGGREYGLAVEQSGGRDLGEGLAAAGSGELFDEDGFGKGAGDFARPQGSINITTTYDSRTNDIESSLVARGDLWRAEASRGGSTSGNPNSPLFLVQLGPVLFVRDTTLLLPVHLSKQHLLWYGYDRKNGMHSLCPALWSKHRRWLLMSMMCLNPFACTFLDFQFPNGQLTYVAGEGLTTSAFLPVLGGLLQAQGQYPGETRVSFSHKNKLGTRITPMIKLPDKSFSLGVVQALAWRRSGLMVRPSIQISICPTFGGRDPGLLTELVHCVKDKLTLIYGCSCSARPTAFASVSLGRSKWNENVGSSGVVIRMETPISNVGRPSFSVQLNSGVEF